MFNENKIQSDLYHDLSHCVRLFTQKNKCLMRLMKGPSLEDKQELGIIKQQCRSYIDKYEDKKQHIEKHWIVIQRFFARVKEMALTLLVKNSLDQSLSQYLSSIITAISDPKKQPNFLFILRLILLSDPLSLTDRKLKLDQSSEPQRKIETKNQTEIFLRSLQKQYELFECMNIDTADYRRRFFMSRQELTRKNNVLLDDMIARNKSTQFTLETYRTEFTHYRCKSAKELRQKKNKIVKQSKNHGETNLKNYQTEEKRKMNISINKNKKVLTTNRQNTDFGSPAKMKTCMSTQSKTPQKPVYKSKVYDNYESEKGNKDTFRITKINFLENQIVIGPQEALDNKNTIRKKILFKKSEENSIKKFQFLSKTIQKKNKNSSNYDSLKLIGLRKQ